MPNQPLSLQVHDHTKIMEFALLNREKIRSASKDKKLDASAILQRCKRLVKDDEEKTQLFSRALVVVRKINQSVAKISDASWRPIVPVVAKLLLAKSVDELESILQAEVKKRDDSDAMKIGLNVAIDILHDGANTIYNPEYWVIAFVADPRGMIGDFGNLMNLVGTLPGKVTGAAKADVTGAVKGAIVGAASGAVRPGGKEGAIAGAIAGAVGGAIDASISSLVE